MEEARETGVSHLVTTLVEVVNKLAGSSYLVEKLMPALTCLLLGRRWADRS